MMSLQLNLIQTQINEQENFSGSMFPDTLEALKKDKSPMNIRRAFEMVTSRKNVSSYYSEIDFWFCELFPKWKKACHNYYNSDGPKLSEMNGITTDLLKKYDHLMSRALVWAMILTENKWKPVPWKRFTELIKDI